jgi:hypothetical protein
MVQTLSASWQKESSSHFGENRKVVEPADPCSSGKGHLFRCAIVTFSFVNIPWDRFETSALVSRKHLFLTSFCQMIPEMF